MSASFSDVRVVGSVVSAVVSQGLLKVTVRVARRGGGTVDVVVSAHASTVLPPGSLIRVLGELSAAGSVEVGAFGEIVMLADAEPAELPVAEASAGPAADNNVAAESRSPSAETEHHASAPDPVAAPSTANVAVAPTAPARTTPFGGGFGRKPVTPAPQPGRPAAALQPPAGLQSAAPPKPSALKPPGMPLASPPRAAAPTRPAFGAPRPAAKPLVATPTPTVAVPSARRNGTLGAPAVTADDEPGHDEADDARHQVGDAPRGGHENRGPGAAAAGQTQQASRVPPTKPDDADIQIPW
jgi:hypothetical protein